MKYAVYSICCIVLYIVCCIVLDNTLYTYITSDCDNINYLIMISLAAVYIISYLTFNDSYDLFKIIRYRIIINS